MFFPVVYSLPMLWGWAGYEVYDSATSESGMVKDFFTYGN